MKDRKTTAKSPRPRSLLEGGRSHENVTVISSKKNQTFSKLVTVSNRQYNVNNNVNITYTDT